MEFQSIYHCNIFGLTRIDHKQKIKVSRVWQRVSAAKSICINLHDFIGDDATHSGFSDSYRLMMSGIGGVCGDNFDTGINTNGNGLDKFSIDGCMDDTGGTRNRVTSVSIGKKSSTQSNLNPINEHIYGMHSHLSNYHLERGFAAAQIFGGMIQVTKETVIAGGCCSQRSIAATNQENITSMDTGVNDASGSSGSDNTKCNRNTEFKNSNINEHDRNGVEQVRHIAQAQVTPVQDEITQHGTSQNTGDQKDLCAIQSRVVSKWDDFGGVNHRSEEENVLNTKHLPKNNSVGDNQGQHHKECLKTIENLTQKLTRLKKLRICLGSQKISNKLTFLLFWQCLDDIITQNDVQVTLEMKYTGMIFDRCFHHFHPFLRGKLDYPYETKYQCKDLISIVKKNLVQN